MERRKMIRLAVGGGLALGAGGMAAFLVSGKGTAELTVDAALRRIDALLAGQPVAHGTWPAGLVFHHCAQSIEYSMIGYPQLKPALFRSTVGPAAFAMFAARGGMRHGLAEPIPGAPELDAAATAESGLRRLRAAFAYFRDFQGVLAPHFAYGPLSKEQYEAAHVMHFWNHLDEISA